MAKFSCGGATGVASVSSWWQLPSCQLEPIPGHWYDLQDPSNSGHSMILRFFKMKSSSPLSSSVSLMLLTQENQLSLENRYSVFSYFQYE